MHSLMYHDVLNDPTQPDASGFAGDDAAIYKVSSADFDRHLESLAQANASTPLALAGTESTSTLAAADAWCMTFDDGGVSAIGAAADALEAHGWRGHFFMTTERIGTPGFLDRQQLRALHERGHIIGSHSHTHPPRLSALSYEAIHEEWKASVDILQDILEVRPPVASVPGGFYSHAVGKAAAAAGIRILFNSEPVSRPYRYGDCVLLGRYAIKRHTSAAQAAGLASGAFLPIIAQRLNWKLRSLAKRLGGQAYLKLRKALLRKRTKER